VPATALRCRVCETQFPLDPIGVCARCFGPLDPIYDRDEQRRTVTRESIAAGPPSIWRYAPLLPVAPPAEVRLPAGWTPLIRARRLEEALGLGELWLKLDTANPRTRSRTGSSRSPLRRRSSSAARRRLLVDRQSRERRRRTRRRGRARGSRALPAPISSPRADRDAVYGAKIFAVEGSYDDCSRLTVELSFELDWAFVNVELRAYYAEGSKTLGFEIAEQPRLGAAGCGRRARSRRERCSRRCTRASASCSSSGRRRNDTAPDWRAG